MSGMRAFRLLAALLQLALPGAAAWADAELDAAGAHATAHFESHTTSACERIHPPDCALCHFLAAPFTARRPAVLRIAITEARAPRPAAPVRFRGAVARLRPPPRAPPALS